MYFYFSYTVSTILSVENLYLVYSRIYIYRNNIFGYILSLNPSKTHPTNPTNLHKPTQPNQPTYQPSQPTTIPTHPKHSKTYWIHKTLAKKIRYNSNEAISITHFLLTNFTYNATPGCLHNFFHPAHLKENSIDYFPLKYVFWCPPLARKMDP